MHLRSVVTAVNDNPAYWRFIPIFVSQWKRLFPEVNIHIIFIGKEIPPPLEPWSAHITVYEPPTGLNTAYVAQIIRLAWPALIKSTEVVMITDMDMIPMSRNYYEAAARWIMPNEIASLRPPVNDKEYAMCYIAGRPEAWSQVFGIKKKEDIAEFLLQCYDNDYDGRHGGSGWTTDQEVLYHALKVTSVPLRVFNDTDLGYMRLEFWDFNYNVDILKSLIHMSNIYSDCHLAAVACPWTGQDILDLCN
jgi:hypothetical protein